MSFTSETKNMIEVPSLHKVAKISSAGDVCRVNDKVPDVPFFSSLLFEFLQISGSLSYNNTTQHQTTNPFVLYRYIFTLCYIIPL